MLPAGRGLALRVVRDLDWGEGSERDCRLSLEPSLSWEWQSKKSGWGGGCVWAPSEFDKGEKARS